MIKKMTKARFNKECSVCSMQNLCMPATGLTKDPRMYFLYTKGYRIPTNEAMRIGKVKHKLVTQHLKELKDIGIDEFKRKLMAGEEINLKEIQICSNFYGLRGIVDDFTIRLEGEDIYVHAKELKSSYYKPYLYQVWTYGLMLTDLNCKLIHEIKRRKVHRMTTNLYPFKQLNLTVDLSLEIFNKKSYTFRFCENNIIIKSIQGQAMSVLAKMKKYRKYHKQGIYDLADLPKCKKCFDDCYFHKYCDKVNERDIKKSKQKYYGKANLLISSKPIIKLDKLQETRLKPKKKSI